jgi:hypothetical protein
MKLGTVFWEYRLDGKEGKLHALDGKRPWGGEQFINEVTKFVSQINNFY